MAGCYQQLVHSEIELRPAATGKADYVTTSNDPIRAITKEAAVAWKEIIPSCTEH